jgi:hypothetical protein
MMFGTPEPRQDPSLYTYASVHKLTLSFWMRPQRINEVSCRAEGMDRLTKSTADQWAWMLSTVYHLWIARNEPRKTKTLIDPKTLAMRTIAGIQDRVAGPHGSQ